MPMINWSTDSGDVPVRSSTSRITCAPRSTAGMAASPPPSLPNGVRAAATMTASVATIALKHLEGAEQVTGDEDALHLARALADLVDLHVSIEASHGRVLHESRATMDLNGVVRACGRH